MIEITTFGLMVLALIVGTLARDYWRAKRDRARVEAVNRIAVEFTGQPIELLVQLIGAPYDMAEGSSGRTLLIWKSPPNEKLPPGSGLLTIVVTVEAGGTISLIEWRDRT
jgi:hypothetical protein